MQCSRHERIYNISPRGGAGGGGRGNAIFFRPLGCVIIYMAPRGRMLNFGQQLCHLHSSIVAEL